MSSVQNDMPEQPSGSQKPGERPSVEPSARSMSSSRAELSGAERETEAGTKAAAEPKARARMTFCMMLLCGVCLIVLWIRDLLNLAGATSASRTWPSLLLKAEARSEQIPC